MSDDLSAVEALVARAEADMGSICSEFCTVYNCGHAEEAGKETRDLINQVIAETLARAVQRVQALDVYLDRNDEPIYRLPDVIAAIKGEPVDETSP